MNEIERAECLLDAGSSGNMNFSIIVAYRGELREQPFRQALAFLQAEHRLLRSSLQRDLSAKLSARGAVLRRHC